MHKELWIYRVLFGVVIFVLAGCLYSLVKQQRALSVLSSDRNVACAVPCLARSTPIVDRNRPWAQVQGMLANTVVQVFVQITQFNWLEPYMTPRQEEAGGSGFFINDKGYFITNAHVVSQARAITIQVPGLGKERLEASIVGVCFDRDMALLRVNDEGCALLRKELGKISYLPLGDSNKVSRGDEIMAIGYPLGQQSLKSTVGVVSGRENVNFRQYIQMDAAINPGSSGGPSVNLAGEVVGISTAFMDGAQSACYIIPINELKIALDDLFACEKSSQKLLRRPLLGVWYHSCSPELAAYLGNKKSGGVCVAQVSTGEVMERAGVKKGDILYEINGRHIDWFGQLTVPWCEDKISLENYAYYLKLHAPITLVVYRKGVRKELHFTFELGELPSVRVKYPEFEFIDYEVIGGMVLMELCSNHLPLLLGASPSLIRYGEPKNQNDRVVIITHILPDSAAQRTRVLRPSMRISEINGVAVQSLNQLRSALKKSARTHNIHICAIDSSLPALVVLPLKQVLRDEPRLSYIYHYPISATVRGLMSGVEHDQKTIGPFSTFFSPPYVADQSLQFNYAGQNNR